MKLISVPQMRLLILCVWTTTMSLAAYGTQDAVLNVPSELLQMFVNESFFPHYGYYMCSMESTILWSTIVSLFAVGAIFGSLFSVQLADYFGRKVTLLGISNVVALLGSACMLSAQYANAFELIVVGRFVLGISAGISTTVLPMYCVELSPIAYRGFVASLHGSIKTTWVFFVMVLSLPSALGTRDAFGYLLAIQAIFSILQIIIYPLCPESPEYLYINRNKKDDAIKIGLQYSLDDDESTESLINRWESQKELVSTRQPLLILLQTSPRFRKALLLAAVVAASRGASGVVVFNVYSTTIFEKIGLSNESAMWASILRQPFAAIFLLLNTLLIDKLGRRTLYLGGLILMAAGWAILFVVLAVEENDPGGIVWLKCVFLVILEIMVTAIYCIGPSNLMWFLATELVPANCRSQISGLVMSFIWVAYLCNGFLFPPISSLIGYWYPLVLFAVPLVIIVIYMSKALPETARIPVADIYKNLNGSKSSQFDKPLINKATSFNSYS